jgi:PTS system mannose-specific IID component
MFLRSFAIQGSWNYRTLIGGGFAFALLPALRAIHRDGAEARDAAVQRHVHIFNSHPYLVGVALGAVAELEAERVDPEVIDRFKTAVRGALGSLGDALVWAGWRPACALLGLAFVFAGAPWWLGPLVFLVVYNAGHVALRTWGFRIGFRHGRNVADVLRRANLARVQTDVSRAAVVLLGMAIPLILGNGGGAELRWAWIAAGVVAVILGLRSGTAARTPIVTGMAVALAAALGYGWLT